MKYRKLNAEVEAVRFECADLFTHGTNLTNAADVARFAGVTEAKNFSLRAFPRCDGFGETFVIDMRTPDGLVTLEHGDWLVRIGGRLEKFTAAAFAEAYEAVAEPDFVARMKTEKAELDAKLARLHDFMNTPIFTQQSRADRLLLSRQSEAMWLYSLILGERLRGLTAGGEGRVASSGSCPGKQGSSPCPATNGEPR